MKKQILVCFLLLGLSGNIAYAQVETNGQPFKALWDSVNSLQDKINVIGDSFQEYIATIDQKISGISSNVDSLLSDVNNLKLENQATKEKLSSINETTSSLTNEVDTLKLENSAIEENLTTINDYLNQSGTNNGSGEGLRKKVYTGTVPDNLDDADLKLYAGSEEDDYYFFKKVEIPELNLSDMPQITLYTKVGDEFTDETLAGFWRAKDELFIDDGAVYINYANKYEDRVNYSIQGDRSYKIVVVY